jgi:tight adherence protein C
MFLLFISAAVSLFILASIAVLYFAGKERMDARLMDVSARSGATFDLDAPRGGLAGVATGFTGALKPLRDLITSNDEDLGYRLALAGFRKPEHVEIYTTAKLLLPVLALLLSSFAGSNMLAIALIGVATGFFAPDIFITQVISRRRHQIRRSLPDALDLLVICMEAGLGIDQALVRVGNELRLTAPALADEFQILNREQRAGKPRLEAWRSMSDRLDIDFVRQFVAMLVQTERFGTPIANALGQFADSLRGHRVQEAEEKASRAGVKLLFPLIVFIFPPLFVVVLGPAILHIGKTLEDFMK